MRLLSGLFRREPSARLSRVHRFVVPHTVMWTLERHPQAGFTRLVCLDSYTQGKYTLDLPWHALRDLAEFLNVVINPTGEHLPTAPAS